MATQPKPKPQPEPKPDDDDAAHVANPPLRDVENERVQTAPLQPAPPKGQQSFGERAVGLSFNPSGDATVNELKSLYAAIIDICHAKRQALMGGSEAHRLWSIAVTEAQGAQMWSVKAATWKD